MSNPDREILVYKSPGIPWCWVKFFETLFFLYICVSNISVVWKQNQTLDLRAYSISNGFDFWPPFQNGHKYWTQLPIAMKICQNMPHIYILKAKTFQVWKIIINRSWFEFFGSKIWKYLWKLGFFSFRGERNLKISEI